MSPPPPSGMMIADRATPAQLCIVPPPTPNGSLHIGHLAGPYLYADVYRRYLAMDGTSTSLPFTTDVHQSYVATAARRAATDPQALADRSTKDIVQTLEAALIDVAHAEIVGSPSYNDFVNDFFETLVEREFIVEQEWELPITETGEFLSEAWIAGLCPSCLAHTCGGICEVCGLPNRCTDLLDPRPSLAASASLNGQTGAAVCLTFDLERLRGNLQQHFAAIETRLRPRLRGLLDDLLSRSLPSIPVTLPGTWGCPSRRMGNGNVFNPWLELLPGHLWAAEKTLHPWTADNAPILFFGFDNSYYYAVVHTALLMAHGDRALPEHYVTNEFYELEGEKFSTSLGHVVWGRDLLARHTPDAVRYYLAKTNPAYQRSEFDESHLDKSVTRDLIAPLQSIAQALRRAESTESAAAWPLGEYVERMHKLYLPRCLDLPALAAGLKNGLSALASRASAGPGTALAGALVQWARLATPLMPRVGPAVIDAMQGGGVERARALDEAISLVEVKRQ